MNKMQDKWKIPLTACMLVLIWSPGAIGTMNIATKHTNISAKSSKTVEKFYRKISDYIFFGPKYDQTAMTKRVDGLFERVQKILGMEGDIPVLQIKLYPRKEFVGLLADGGKRRSFYLYNYKTVYVNVDDIHAGMLAHEMSHHIVDEWFGGRLPRKTAEIIAMGVERGII